MSADVNRRLGAVVVDHLGVAAEEVVDDPVNTFFIAGNDARTEHYGVARLDFGVAVVVHGGAGECAHRLALRPADHYHDLLGRIVANLAWSDKRRGRQGDITEILRDFRGLGEAAPDQRDLAMELVRHLGCQLDAVNRRRKAGDEEPAAGVSKDFFELGTYGALAGGEAGALHVSRILQQGQHALLAVFGKGVQVEEFIVSRCGIDFEVAGVDDDAQAVYARPRRRHRRSSA